MHLELARSDGLFHVDACIREPPEVVFASRGIDEMERPVPPVEAVLDERLKDAVMLVHPVEERADVVIHALEIVRLDPQRAIVGIHDLTSGQKRRVLSQEAGPYGDPRLEHTPSTGESRATGEPISLLSLS